MNRPISPICFLRPLWAAGIGVALLASGCHRDGVEVHRLPKESAEPQNAQMPPAGDSFSLVQPGPAPASLTWTLPAGWQEQAPSEMRVASFNVPGKDGKTADVSVVPLAGLAGGDLANVNRWRGQVGLAPVSADDLAKQGQQVQVGDEPAELYDQAGQNAAGENTRIIGVIQHRGDSSWFFKMTGDGSVVEQQKPAFIAFLKSVKFGSPETAALPPSHPPVEGMAMASAGAGAGPSAEAHPKWQAPAGWQETAGGPFLVDKFLIGGEGGAQASVNISTSAGDGGGVAANVNRWRRQLGLPEAPEADLGKDLGSIEIPGGKATFVDLTGTDAGTGQSARLIAMVVPQPGQTWFYKLMGDARLVEREKAAFTNFVQSVQYSNAR